MHSLFQFKPTSKVLVAVVFLTQFSVFHLNAQMSEKEQILARKANLKYSFSDYNKALPLYLDLLKIDSTNFNYNYKAGVCYLKSNLETTKSVKYLEIAKKSKAITDGASYEFYYYLGSAYHLVNRFDDAIDAYNLAKTFPNAVDSLLERGIKQCEAGKKMMQQPAQAKVFSLGKNVNSPYPDYSPIVLPDNSAIIFTSTRKGSTGGKQTIDGSDFYEDVYVAKNTNINTSGNPGTTVAEYATAKNAGTGLNTIANDACISTSPDGRALIFYRKNKLCQADIYNGRFGKPKRIPVEALNKTDVVPSLYFTTDATSLFFISERPGGFGGKDIYKSTKQDNGKWGPAENLGSVINSNLDEESPYFDTESNTLYFSSQGHNSIGGFDVFKTKLQKDGSWSVPESMGYPINSGADDIFYSYNQWDNTGYFSSIRSEGVGNYDIFMVRYIQPIKVALHATYAGNLMPKNLKITIQGPEEKDSLKVPVNQKNEVTYRSNRQYKMLIPRYNDDNIMDTLRFKTPESLGGFTSYQEINFEPVKNHRGLLIGYKTTVYNVFFDMEREIEKSGLRKSKSFMSAFPFCRTISPAMQIYAKDKLTKEEEYAGFVRNLKPDHKNFKIYSQTSYVDTSSFELIYKMQDSIAAATEKTSAYLNTMSNESVSADPKEVVSKMSAPVSDKENKSISRREAKKAQAKEEKTESVSADKSVSKSNIAAAEPAPATSGDFGVIYFNPASSVIDKKYEEQIMKIAEYMKQNENVIIEIRGYSDAAGKEEFNTILSEDRALSVKRMLMKQGISSERMKANGYGVDKAKEAKKGESVDAGRRVDFKVISKGKKRIFKK